MSAFLPMSHNYFYWFIACYLFLMLLSPLINKGLQVLNNKQLLFTIGALVYMNCISGWLFKNDINTNGFNTMHMIFMYVLGFGVCRFKLDKKFKMWYWTSAYIVLSVLIAILTPYWGEYGGYNNPLVVLKSVVAFCLFLCFRFHNDWINRIAKCVFPCYLLQEGAFGVNFYSVQYELWHNWQNTYQFYGFVVGCVIAFFTIALLLEPLRKICMYWGINKMYVMLHLNRIEMALKQ